MNPYAAQATPVKLYSTLVEPLSPCAQMTAKSYQTPPHLYAQYQPVGLPQFGPGEALANGTLWPAFANSYFGAREVRS